MKALVSAFNQEKALVGAFSVIVKNSCGTDGALHSTNIYLITTWTFITELELDVSSGCRVRMLRTHSMRTRPAARTRTAADRCDRDLWPKRISQLYYDSGFQVQEASAEWDDSRSARTGGIHSLQWKVRRAFLLFTFILYSQRRFLALAISVCESMFDVSEYNGKRETKSKRLTKIR